MSQNLGDMKRQDWSFAGHFLQSIQTQLMEQVPIFHSRTSVELVYDSLQPFLEGDGIGGTLECKAKLSVLNSPVMEDGVHLVVHQTPLHGTLQHWLRTQTARPTEHRVVQNVSPQNSDLRPHINMDLHSL